MNPQGNPTPLDEARRRTSLDKRQRALTALETLEHHGTKITFTAVARTAGVSTWLTYTPGIREHIEAARTRQTHPTTAPPAAGQRPDPATLRTEADLARHEIKNLREERDRLRDALRHQLGQQLDHLTGPDLAARTEELATRNQQLTDQLQHATTENTALRARVTALEADLAAARTSLRRMIRDENRTVGVSGEFGSVP